jgi:DNA-binding PadR family transcriptional regulator
VSDDSLYLGVQKYNDYLIVHRGFIRRFGPAGAIVFTEILRKERDLANSGKLPPDRWFYFLQEKISETTGLSTNQVADYIKKFQGQALIQIERRGNPAKNYYRLNQEEVENLLELEKGNTGISSPESGGQKPHKVEISSPTKLGTILHNDLSNNDLNKNKYRSALEDALPGDAVASLELGQNQVPEKRSPGETKTRRMKKGYLELLRDATARGAFANRLPDDASKPATKRLLDAQEFLVLLEKPMMFGHKYEFDDAWFTENKIDLGYFKGKTREELFEIVRMAVDRFAKMRMEGYRPYNKEYLTTDIGEFFYHSIQKKSWFLVCVFNEPKRYGQKGDAE